MGLNEAAGYVAVAATALATGYLAASYGLRPEPFYLGIAYAALGLGLSALAMRETREHARLEAVSHTARADGRHDHLHAQFTDREVFAQTSFREPALSSASQAGMVNNLKRRPGLGLVPGAVRRGGSIDRADRGARRAVSRGVGPRAAGHQRAVGSSRRKPLIVGGMLLQAGALVLVAGGGSSGVWAVAAVLLGAGTAMVYPTLLAAIGDVAHPAWRARSVGVYRLWRDGGFAVGALAAGLLADAFGIPTAVWVIAGLTAASGLLVAMRMYETHPRTISGEAA